MTDCVCRPSDSVTTISTALKELDELVAKRKSDKIVVKIMWDRGALGQLIHNHLPVSPSTWIGLDLPSPESVPNLALQVINFHRPPLGTFHQKALIVDRKVALLNSNNIQDRPNVEMMIHLEGPVVDSLYDTLLLSWHEQFNPPLPCVVAPSPNTNPAKPWEYTFSDGNKYLGHIDLVKAAKAARMLLAKQNDTYDASKGADPNSVPHWWMMQRDGIFGSKELGVEQQGRPAAHQPSGGGFANLVKDLVDRAKEDKARNKGTKSGARTPTSGFKGLKPVDENSATTSDPTSSETTVVDHTEKNENTTAAAVSTQQPTQGSKPTPQPNTLLAPPLESSSSQSQLSTPIEEKDGTLTPSTSAIIKSVRLRALSKSLNAGALKKIEAAFEDEHLIDDFKPHFLHKAHKPFRKLLSLERYHSAC